MLTADPAPLPQEHVPVFLVRMFREIMADHEAQEARNDEMLRNELRGEAGDAEKEISLAERAVDDKEISRILDDDGMIGLIWLAKRMKEDAKQGKELRNQAVEINLDPNLTDSQKREQLKAIERQEEEIYREAIKSFKEETAMQKKD